MSPAPQCCVSHQLAGQSGNFHLKAEGQPRFLGWATGAERKFPQVHAGSDHVSRVARESKEGHLTLTAGGTAAPAPGPPRPTRRQFTALFSELRSVSIWAYLTPRVQPVWAWAFLKQGEEPEGPSTINKSSLLLIQTARWAPPCSEDQRFVQGHTQLKTENRLQLTFLSGILDLSVSSIVSHSNPPSAVSLTPFK